MRRSILFVLILLVWSVGLVSYVQAQAAAWYQHPEGAYRMKLPAGWKQLAPNLERGVDIIAVSESSEEMLICDRKSTDLKGLTPEQSLATFELSLKQSTLRQQLSRTTIGGMPAVLASNYDPSKQIASYTLIALYQQHSYQFGASISSRVVLPTPPAVVRECWATIEWQNPPSDTQLAPQPDGQKHPPLDQQVSVIQVFTPSAMDPSDDVLWEQPAAPQAAIRLPAFSVDADSLAWCGNRLQPGSRAVISQAQEAMRLLYGPMNSQQAQLFEAKWAPYYHQTTTESDARIKAITPLLGKMVVARSGFAQSARCFYRLLVRANIARASGQTRDAAEALRLCRHAQTLMIGYQACVETLCRQLEATGDLPNPNPAGQSQRERFLADLKRTNVLAELPELPGADRLQMLAATELHKDYLNNLSQCFSEARQDQAARVIQNGVVQPEALRRLLWSDTLQRLADDELSRVETGQQVHRRSLTDDFNAQILMNWGREEAQKVQRVMELLQTASMLQSQIPQNEPGGMEAAWNGRINAKLLVTRNADPLSEWVQELAQLSNRYWSRSTSPEASVQLRRAEALMLHALTSPTGVFTALSDVPISGLGSAGALCWGADHPTMAALEGAQGYQPGGALRLARRVLSWSQSLCRAAQSAIDHWDALPRSEPDLKPASDILAISRCLDFGQLYAGDMSDPSEGSEPDVSRFQADIQQGKRLAEAYVLAEQRLESATALDTANPELPALLSAAQQLAASVAVNTPAKVALSQMSVQAEQLFIQRMAAMNQAIYTQMVQILTKQGYQPNALRMSTSGVAGVGSIDCFMADTVTAVLRGQEMVSVYQLLQDARAAYYQCYESVSRYGGQHGGSAKSESMPSRSLPFATALTAALVKQQIITGQPWPLSPLRVDEMGQAVDTASFKMPVSSDMGIMNTQEQCRQLNRDIRLKLIPWLEARAASSPQTAQAAATFRKLQMVLERASRKLPNPGILALATQELDRFTGGFSVEQLAVYLTPMLDKLSRSR